jgi:hypothetical protein
MHVEWVLQETPLWLLLPLLYAAMVLAAWYGGRVHRRVEEEAGEASAKGYVLSGMLGLLALLVAFTFGMALNRYETRRGLVVTEATALNAAYLRTSLLDYPGPLRTLIRQYAEARLEFGLAGGAEAQAAERKSADLQATTWAEAVRVVTPIRQTPLAGFALTPLNEAFNAATARRAAVAARVPTSVLVILILYMLCMALVLGYLVAGTDRRARRGSLALFALFCLALGVILDLDRPVSGTIRVPQGAMTDAIAAMAAN